MGVSLNDILRLLGEHAEDFRRMGVRELAVFGSAATGTARDDSDLDFLVAFDEKTFDAYMDLKIFLQDMFHRRVDLVLKDAVKPRLKAAIEESAVHVNPNRLRASSAKNLFLTL